MDVQINEAEQLCAILVGLIDPIYRQHGISSDVLEELSKRFSEADPGFIVGYFSCTHIFIGMPDLQLRLRLAAQATRTLSTTP